VCPLVSIGLSIIVTIGACEYLCCVFWAFVSLWIAQMITVLVPSRVLIIMRMCYLFEVLLPLLLGVHNPVLCIVFIWSSCPCLYTARRNLGAVKKTITHSCVCLQIIHTNVTYTSSVICVSYMCVMHYEYVHIMYVIALFLLKACLVGIIYGNLYIRQAISYV
jgi:hypothetical protein